MSVVPECYHGVWARTLLETPGGRDTTTWVRWLQTGLWHGDLRVPADADRRTPQGLAQQQGFAGTTAITRPDPDQPEVCTWQRVIDMQPPRSTPDAGHMVFETPSRVIETGLHGTYLEVWERLPGSTGRRIALARLDADGQPTAERLLVAGQFLMHLRPRAAAWPADLRPDETLGDVVQRHPDRAAAWLDFDIAFGPMAHGEWAVERATRPELEGQTLPCALHRVDAAHARVERGPLAGRWQLLEWLDEARDARAP
ncbi:MAG: hypothetical protein IV088_05490 [Hydrogenophaga sp.]|uniref:hypothetical protein n=1 Tax=Hydrogenophaga sp. TaxID=1904254 RepID=UPI0025BDD75C|nr:hypothetical protein [Hydrogenophaga sp.]MBT9550282.1 hypothetical protein [Hydrogenophaga sp.]